MLESVTTCALPDDSSHIVVLEPDEALAKSIAMAIWAETGMNPCVTSTASDAADFIADHAETLFAAVMAVDAPEVVPLLAKVTEHSIPVVVHGTGYLDEHRDNLAHVNIADTVFGDRTSLATSVGKSLGRLSANRFISILVVDDSLSMRTALIRFLKTRCYRTLGARDGLEALEQLERHKEIKLVITDNEMPNMDGFSLVREIRKTHSKEDLAVIGISAKTGGMLSVRFINNGANDFLHKPFVREELYCRVDHNVDMLSRIKTIRDLSYKDPLTRLYNRRYFFENCDEFAQAARDAGKLVSVAMLDIDHFKSVNDTYGHDVGDQVLKAVSATIVEMFPEDAIVARFGGEEFCVLAALPPGSDFFALHDKVRRAVGNSTIRTDDFTITTTISVGVCMMNLEVEEMIKVADGFLYTAKESGRDRVIAS